MGSEVLPTDVSELIERGVLAINDGYRAKNSELGKNGLPFARGGNINGGFHFEGADCFPRENLDRVGEKTSQPGDAVFTSKGSVGRFAFVTADVPTFVYSPQLCFWRSLDHDVISPRWLYYWMYGAEFYQQYNGVKGQTDMADYVSLRDQRGMHITLPPVKEQTAIADILGTLDDKIELNRQMNRTLEAMARAIFKAWFVDFEPVKAKTDCATSFRGMPQAVFDQLPDSFTDSELGPVPEGWEVAPLDEIADFLNGVALQKYPASPSEDSLPVIKIAELRNGVSTKSGRASRGVPSKYIVDDGDFLFSWSGSLLAKFWTEGEGALNQHLFKVTSESYPMWFVSQWVQYHLDTFQAIAASKATTMGHIQRRHLKEALTVCAPSHVLDDMSTIMSPLIEKMIAAELESRTLTSIRDALLPKLISGEVSTGAAITEGD
ncbi:restriction endonuclease subunit S [Halomonas sp. BC04]|uniref:restriction endonuclease subunit S n=1 Tax=Halomonas sp. BC04 TaxID=1403540 RepID=UPI0003ED79A0|nr:restriction endonuclease subunit S [Halomonas sp. BC04]EWH00023.1 hypothetical protein Q427_21660 [Halomonas sp. BC04]